MLIDAYELLQYDFYVVFLAFKKTDRYKVG